MNTLTKMDRNADIEANRSYLSPPVDIYETKEAYVLEADMPGVNKQGLEILLEGNELTLVGHREPPPQVGDVVHREAASLDFRRAFELDPSIDSTRISAQIEQGQLRLLLPKAERLKPRQIAVTD